VCCNGTEIRDLEPAMPFLAIELFHGCGRQPTGKRGTVRSYLRGGGKAARIKQVLVYLPGRPTR